MKRVIDFLIAFVILLGNTPVYAAFNNPGVSVADVPVATEFFLPFGNTSESIKSVPTQGTFSGFPTTVFEESFRNIEVNQNNLCGGELNTESPGWYVYTPHNSDRSYDLTPYLESGAFHPGEDWNGQRGGFDDICQSVFPIAEGVILAKGTARGFGNMLIILHRLPGGDFFISVFGHLYDIPSKEVGTTVDSTDIVGQIGKSGPTPFPHLHWEIRKDSFLEIIGGIVRLKDIGNFRPATWPAAVSPEDKGQSFIAENYCNPSVFIQTGGVCSALDFVGDSDDIQPGPNVGDVVSIPMFSGGLTGFALEADGKTALVTEGSGELSRVDLETGKVTTIAFVDSSRIGQVAIELEGQTAIVITRSGSFSKVDFGLSRVNLSNRQVETIIENGIARAPSFASGSAIALEPDGESVLVLISGGNGGLSRVNLGTGEITLISAVGGPGLAIEQGGATALVTRGFTGVNSFSFDLERIDLSTGATTKVATLPQQPVGVSIEPGGSTALVTTSLSGGRPRNIYRVDLTSGQFSFLPLCLDCTFSQIVAEPSGDSALFLGDFGNALIRLQFSNIKQTVLARSANPQTMAISRDGTMAFSASSSEVSAISLTNNEENRPVGYVEKIVTNSSTSSSFPRGGMVLNKLETSIFYVPTANVVLRVDLINKTSGIAISLFTERFAGLALEENESAMYVTVPSENSLLRKEFGITNATVVTDQLQSPEGMVIEEDNLNALVVGRVFPDAIVSRVNLQSGAINRIGTVPISFEINTPYIPLALEPDGENVLIGGHSLSRMNLSTGEVTEIASGLCLSGGQVLTAIAVEAGGTTALVSNSFCGILRVRIKAPPTSPDPSFGEL